MQEYTTLATALNVLSAMIAPVVLISACASLAISTSNRLARAIERSRKLLERYEQLENGMLQSVVPDDENNLLYDQLGLASHRTKLLHRALTGLYLALSLFIATSVILAFTVLIGERFSWVPLMLGILGAGLLFYTSVLLIVETRLARSAIHAEIDFILHRLKDRRVSSPVVD